jgi:hypothetical protein
MTCGLYTENLKMKSIIEFLDSASPGMCRRKFTEGLDELAQPDPLRKKTINVVFNNLNSANRFDSFSLRCIRNVTLG